MGIDSYCKYDNISHYTTLEYPLPRSRSNGQYKLCGRRIWRVPLRHGKTDGHFVVIVLRRRSQCESRFDTVERDRHQRPQTFAATFGIDRPPTWSCLYFATYVREKSTLDPWWLAVSRYDNESHPVDPTTRWPPLVAAKLFRLPYSPPPACAAGFSSHVEAWRRALALPMSLIIETGAGSVFINGIFIFIFR